MNKKLFRTILFVTLVAIPLISCADNSEKRAVLDYLNKEYPQIAPFEIISISEPEMLATPFMELNSCLLIYLQTKLDILNDIKRIYQLPEMEKKQEKAAAVKKYEEELAKLKEVYMDIMIECDHPDLPSLEKNRKGVKVTYSAGGHQGEGYFFFNNDGKTIGHTSMSNRTQFKELTEAKYGAESTLIDLKYL